MGKKEILKSLFAVFLLSSCRPAPSEGVVILNETLSGVSTDNRACFIEAETPANLITIPGSRNQRSGQILTQRQLRNQENKWRAIICTVYPSQTPLGFQPQKFPIKIFEHLKPPQAEISRRSIPLSLLGR